MQFLTNAVQLLIWLEGEWQQSRNWTSSTTVQVPNHNLDSNCQTIALQKMNSSFLTAPGSGSKSQSCGFWPAGKVRLLAPRTHLLYFVALAAFVEKGDGSRVEDNAWCNYLSLRVRRGNCILSVAVVVNDTLCRTFTYVDVKSNLSVLPISRPSILKPVSILKYV